MFKAVYYPGVSKPSQQGGQGTTTIENPAFPPSFKPPSPVLALVNDPVKPQGPSTIQTAAGAVGAAAGGAIIGGALGTLIPIPGVGTAIGAAVGGAVAPTIVNAIGDVASSIGHFFGF